MPLPHSQLLLCWDSKPAGISKLAPEIRSQAIRRAEKYLKRQWVTQETPGTSSSCGSVSCWWNNSVVSSHNGSAFDHRDPKRPGRQSLHPAISAGEKQLLPEHLQQVWAQVPKFSAGQQDFFSFYKYYLAMPVLSCGMQELVPWLGIKPGPPCIGSTESQPLGHQGSPRFRNFFFSKVGKFCRCPDKRYSFPHILLTWS